MAEIFKSTTATARVPSNTANGERRKRKEPHVAVPSNTAYGEQRKRKEPHVALSKSLESAKQKKLYFKLEKEEVMKLYKSLDGDHFKESFGKLTGMVYTKPIVSTAWLVDFVCLMFNDPYLEDDSRAILRLKAFIPVEPHLKRLHEMIRDHQLPERERFLLAFYASQLSNITVKAEYPDSMTKRGSHWKNQFNDELNVYNFQNLELLVQHLEICASCQRASEDDLKTRRRTNSLMN
jgi:hypothetical protein